MLAVKHALFDSCFKELTQQLSQSASGVATINPAVLAEIVMDLNGSYQAMFLQYQKVFEQARQHYEQALATTQQQVDATCMTYLFLEIRGFCCTKSLNSSFACLLKTMCSVPAREAASMVDETSRLQEAMGRDQGKRQALAQEVENLRAENASTPLSSIMFPFIT